MLEMLKQRKASLEERGKKGFTLMEMLIVIAIIAILIAIAIPVFTSQLGRANLGTDESNIRSGYAQVQSDIMLSNLESVNTAISYYLLPNGEVARSSVGTTKAINPGATDFYTTQSSTDGSVDIGGIPATWTTGQKVVYTVLKGEITGISSTDASVSITDVTTTP